MRRLLIILLMLLPALARADDRGVLQAFIEDNLSGAGRTVKIEGFQGALSSRASFDLLTVADDQGVWLTIKGAVLDWNRLALLQGNLSVNELSADEIILDRIPTGAGGTSTPSPESTPFSLPNLPVSIDIGKLAVKTLKLGQPVLGEAASFTLAGDAHLAGGEGKAKLDLTRTDGPAAKLALSGDFSNATRNLTLSLGLSEAAGGILGHLIGLPGTPAFDLSLKGAGPLGDFGATLTLATDGQPRVTGDFKMVDRPDPAAQGHTIRGFTAQLGGDLRPLVAAQYHAFLGPKMELSLKGDRYDDGRIDVSAFKLAAEAMRLAGSFATDPSGFPVRAKLTGDITPAAGKAVTLLLPGQPTQVDQGHIDFSYDATKGSAWTLAADLQGFSRANEKIDKVTLDGTGNLDVATKRVSGKITANAAGLALADQALATALGTDLSLSTGFDWKPGAPLALDGLKLAGPDYGVAGKLSFAGVDGSIDLAVDGAVDVTAKDLSRFAALAGQPISGSGTLNIKGKVTPLSGAFDATVTGQTTDLTTGVAQLDPLLKGKATLDVAASRGSYGIRLTRLSVKGAGATVTASGTLATGAANLDFLVALDDLATVVPGATGPARVSGSAQQQGETWTGRAAVEGPGGVKASFDGSLGLTAAGVGDVSGKLTVAAADLTPYRQAAGRPLGGALSATVQAKGNWTARTGSVHLTGTSQDLTTGIAEADAALAGAGTYDIALSRDANGRVGIETFDVKTPLVTASAKGEATPSKSAVDFSVDIADVGRLVSGFTGPAQAKGSATATGGDWTVDTSLSAAGGATAKVSGTVAPDASTADLRITGTAPLGYADRFIAPNRVEGTARFDLTLAGKPSIAALGGNVTIENGRFSAPTAKFGLTGIGGTVRLASGTATLDLTAQARTGGGVKVTGTTGITAPYQADITYDLTNVVVTEPGLYHTDVSGRGTVTGPMTGAPKLGGAFTLGPTEILLSDIPAASAVPVEGLVHTNEPVASRETRLRAGLISTGTPGPSKPWPIDISVDAPNRIFLRGRGLDAEFGGNLKLTGTTAAVVTQGAFNLIRGRLDILGKRLTLTEAEVRMQGDFNPYIKTVATTQSGDIQITVTLEGPATAPVVTFSSSPDLPQDEIVSRLLFDKGITQVSPLQALRIASALRTLAGKGGSLSDTIRSKTGLDNLDVTTTATGQTEVTAGKYLSQNIYSDVTVDDQGNSTVHLNLSLSPHVTARGTVNSDGTSSVGVFFDKDY